MLEARDLRVGEATYVKFEMRFSDFLRVALFRNYRASKASRVENRGQISQFFTPVKFRGRMG